MAADRWGGWHCPRHWSLYTRDSLSGLLEQQGLRVERTEYLLSPFIWAHTLQNVVRDRPAWRWASGVLSERSVPALLAYGVLDTVQRWTRWPDVEHAGCRPEVVGGRWPPNAGLGQPGVPDRARFRIPYPSVSRIPFPVPRSPFPVPRSPFPVSRFPFPVSRVL